MPPMTWPSTMIGRPPGRLMRLPCGGDGELDVDAGGDVAGRHAVGRGRHRLHQRGVDRQRERAVHPRRTPAGGRRCRRPRCTAARSSPCALAIAACSSFIAPSEVSFSEATVSAINLTPVAVRLVEHDSRRPSGSARRSPAISSWLMMSSSLLEPLAAGALLDRVDDDVGRRGAVLQHDPAGGRQPRRLVGLERRDRIALALEQARQRRGIDDRLRAAVAALRIHRMRGVAEQRHAAERPAFAADRDRPSDRTGWRRRCASSPARRASRTSSPDRPAGNPRAARACSSRPARRRRARSPPPS